MRPTLSPGLYYQMVGRGLRASPEKENCLVLDFAGNVMRHGPIDSLSSGWSGSHGDGEGEPPMRICPMCRGVSHIAIARCNQCGYVWPVEEKRVHESRATTAPLLSSKARPRTVRVNGVRYAVHKKTGRPDSMRVTYEYGICDSVSEWICVEHQGYAHRVAKDWWRDHMTGAMPDNANDACIAARKSKMRNEITIKKIDGWMRVI